MRVWKAEEMQSTRWMTSFVENGEVLKTSYKCRLTAAYTPIESPKILTNFYPKKYRH